MPAGLITGGDEVKKLFLVSVLIGCTAIGAVSATAQITPNNKWTSFYDSLTTYNGVAAPIGSIIKAYDPDGVLCGLDTVGLGPTSPAGWYGFMPVYGDDPTTPGVDEGAVTGDSLHFKINDRPATIVLGDPTWNDDQSYHKVSLSASPTSVVMTVVETPTAKAATFNRTTRFRVGVRNDGDGLDFYHIVATNADTSFHTILQDSFVYANPGATVYTNFDIHTPFFTASGDTVDAITFTVNSGVDTTQRYTGTVDLYLTVTDVDDHGNTLPGGFALRQNYPNPFNPSTTISYELPRASSVRLEIIDVLGQIVETQELGIQSAGSHDIPYDGSQLASGMYFYRIATDYASQVRKMLLVK